MIFYSMEEGREKHTKTTLMGRMFGIMGEIELTIRQSYTFQ